jgi:hypothetical protein
MWKTLLHLDVDNLPILKDRGIIVKDYGWVGIVFSRKNVWRIKNEKN